MLCTAIGKEVERVMELEKTANGFLDGVVNCSKASKSLALHALSM